MADSTNEKVEKEEKKTRTRKAKETPKEAPKETPKEALAEGATPKEKPVEKPAEKVVFSEQKEPKARKTRKKKAGVSVVSRGKRKESIARAHVSKGKGNIRINNRSLVSYVSNKYVREIVREPLRYLGPEALDIDVHVNVFGGGVLGQAQASRTAIAKALVAHFPDANLKDKFLAIDRSLLVEDVRRVEPKKYKGPKARARFQKSYR